MSSFAATEQIDPDLVQPGWIALIIVLALVVATFLLWRSMNSQLRKIQLPKAERPDRRLAYDARPAAANAADDATEETTSDASEEKPDEVEQPADDRSDRPD